MRDSGNNPTLDTDNPSIFNSDTSEESISQQENPADPEFSRQQIQPKNKLPVAKAVTILMDTFDKKAIQSLLDQLSPVEHEKRYQERLESV